MFCSEYAKNENIGDVDYFYDHEINKQKWKYYYHYKLE